MDPAREHTGGGLAGRAGDEQLIAEEVVARDVWADRNSDRLEHGGVEAIGSVQVLHDQMDMIDESSAVQLHAERFCATRRARSTTPEDGMKVIRIDHVQIPIPPGGEDAARAFYSGVLGLTEVPKPEPMRARGGMWFAEGIHLGIEDGNASVGEGAPCPRGQ